MKVAVVFMAPKNRDRMLSLARALGRGIESQSHQVDILDGAREVNVKLTIYKYIAFATESISMFGGKIPEQVGRFLSSAGQVAGKRSFAFVPKTRLGAGRALFRLMKIMESEGMYLKNSEVIQSEIEAEEIGKRLHIEAPSKST